jgi:hypothetical protein
MTRVFFVGSACSHFLSSADIGESGARAQLASRKLGEAPALPLPLPCGKPNPGAHECDGMIPGCPTT